MTGLGKRLQPVDDQLALFLQRAAGRRFHLGEFDCGLFLADWCLEITGIDPTASLRGRYSSVDEVQRLVGVANLPHAFGRMLLAAGFRLTKRPVYGDVAMIKPVGSDICGAMVTTGYVVLNRGGGLSRIRRDHARLVVAWSVGDHHSESFSGGRMRSGSRSLRSSIRKTAR
jgi:hypothetical protein